MSENWLWMSGGDLGRGIAQGEIDPLALTEAYLAAIKSHEFRDRIYARLTEDRALAEAESAQARAKAGTRLGPLDGVPISWKDLYDVAGYGCEGGTALLKGRVAERDALCVTRAAAAGLVCLGKTHTTELAFSGLGVNPITATPPNVHDHAAAPGGSSSGAATSVAFGLAVAGIGSDTGGSVRIPAVWNDLVGLKTTHGLISLDGVIPLCRRFDTVGPLTRSVEDASLLTAIMAGQPLPDLSQASLKGARFLVSETVGLDDIEPEVARGFEDALAKLEAAGAVIERGEIPEVARGNELGAVLFAAEAYGEWGHAIEAQPDVMYPQIKERFEGGLAVSAPQFVAAWNELDALRVKYLERVASYDAVLAPTAPITPPNVHRLETEDAYFKRANLLALRNTRMGNMMGLCALTLPTGVPGTGIMLLCPPDAEAQLSRLGTAAEAALR